MEKFSKVTSVVAPLKLDNVDTDMLIPKQFLKTIKRTGLGQNLFHEMRYDLDGNFVADFVLNKTEYAKSQILLSGENFGCGSSREHAPWALFDFGIKVIIATSYADIFYNNCFKNSILPIILSKAEIEKLWAACETNATEASVDLEAQTITIANLVINFEIDPFRKKCLLEGLDDIALTMQHDTKIDEFEGKQQQREPWLYEAAQS